MKHQAVVFDLFETLITEWGHRKYVKSEMRQDQHPWKRESMPGFLIAERPLDVLREV